MINVSVPWYESIIWAGPIVIFYPVVVDRRCSSRCPYLKAYDLFKETQMSSFRETSDSILTCLDAVNITPCVDGDPEALRVALAVMHREHETF